MQTKLILCDFKGAMSGENCENVQNRNRCATLKGSTLQVNSFFRQMARLMCH